MLADQVAALSGGHAFFDVLFPLVVGGADPELLAPGLIGGGRVIVDFVVEVLHLLFVAPHLRVVGFERSVVVV